MDNVSEHGKLVRGKGGDTDPFEELYDRLAWKSTAPFEPVLYSLRAPTHRLVLLAEAQTGVVYPEKLYGLRIPAFSEVYGDEVKDTVVSVTVQRQAETDGHRVVVNNFMFDTAPLLVRAAP